MTQQYQDILSAVNIEIKDEDIKAVSKYANILKAIKVLLVALVVIVIVLLMTDSSWTWPVLIGTYAFIAVYILYRYSFSTQMLRLQTHFCRPDRFLSVYMALVAYAKEKSKWELHFYNIAISLIYLARHEDARKITDLFRKYCPTNKGKVCYTLLCIQLAYRERNAELLAKHAEALHRLVACTKLDARTKNLCSEALMLPVRLELENKGEYEELYKVFLQPVVMKSNLAEVKQKYYLYKIAVKLGKAEEAEEYKAVVLQKGGTTFYREELSQIYNK